MNIFKKHMTWGGFIGLCGLCFAIIVALICRAFGLHKMLFKKLKDVKDRIFNK